MIASILECWIFYYTGLVICIRVMIGLASVIFVSLYRKMRPINFTATYGKDSYALITGPTSGIGKHAAVTLCAKGLNLVLVGRDAKRLDGLKRELLQKSPKCKIVIIEKDFTQSMSPDFSADIDKLTKDLDISIVFNNVGVFYSSSMSSDLYLERKKPEELLDMLYVNIISYTMNHFYFYPRFQKRAFQSAFIDISSTNSILVAPTFNIYGSTKIFGRYLINSLANQNTNPKIKFLCYVCGPVETNMMVKGKEYFKRGLSFSINPDLAIESALNCVGLFQDSSALLQHELMATSMKLLSLFERTMVYELLYILLKKTDPEKYRH